MNSVLKKVCKLKVPLKIVERPHTPCETGKLAICPKSSSNLNSSRSYIAYNENAENSLHTLQTRSNLPCSLRCSFAQKTKNTGCGRTAPIDENDKKKDEVSVEQCMNQKNDKREKKNSEKSIKFTINLNELVHNFNRKNNSMKAQGINKINTFSLKPGKCRCCTSRKKNQIDKFEQRRFISFSSKGRMQLPKYQVNKIRKSLSYKPQSGGTLSYKIRESSRGMYRKEKALKVPLFHILKDKVHSNPPVAQELCKQLRYNIGTKEASLENQTNTFPAPYLNISSVNSDNCQASSCLKSIHENKSCVQTPDVTRKISEYKLNFDNLKKSHIFRMLSEIIIPLIEKESMQYEEMRKAFVHLQKELELYFKQMESSGNRSENEVFKIIADMNQAKKRQKELEAASQCVKDMVGENLHEKSEIIDKCFHEDKYCIYGSCSDISSNNQRGNANCQLDEFPIAILVNDRKQQMKPQHVQHSYLGIGNSIKNSLKARSSEKGNKHIAARTFVSDSKSTNNESGLELEMPLNSFIDKESDAGCFQYFQSKSIPRQIMPKQKEQFAIPFESEFKGTTPLIKCPDPGSPKKNENKDDASAKCKSVGSAIYESSRVMPSSHSSYNSVPRKEIEQPKPTSQAAISKSGMKNLKRLEKSKEDEVQLPFQDFSSQKTFDLVQPNKVMGKAFPHSNDLPTHFSMKTAKKIDTVKPKPVFQNKVTPAKIAKSQSTPTLKTDSGVYKNKVDKPPHEKRTTVSLLDNCRGLFETLLRKFKGPPKRSLGSSILSRKSHSTPALKIEDNNQKCVTRINKPAVALQLKQKYPWNRLGMNEKMLTRKFKSGAKRLYSSETRKYSFCIRGLTDYSIYCHKKSER